MRGELQLKIVKSEAGMSKLKSKQAVVLDEVIAALTNSSRAASPIGDRLLAYLIDMAVFHANRIKLNEQSGTKQQLRSN